MVLDRKHFDLGERPLFEKLTFKHPFKKKGVFEDSACFLHFKDGNSRLYSPLERINIDIKENILLRCGTYFSEYMKVDDPSQVYAVHLYPDVLKEIYKNEIPPILQEGVRPAYAVKIPNKNVINHFIESLDFYFDNPELVNPELLKLKLKELILLLLQSEYAKSVGELISTLFSPRQVNFKALIEEHLYSNLSLDNLADMAGLSLSSFKRQFKEFYEDSPARYIRIKKLEKAEELLKLTKLSIGDICFKIGFDYTTNFAKAFKKKNGITAQAFRETNKNSRGIDPG